MDETRTDERGPGEAGPVKVEDKRRFANPDAELPATVPEEELEATRRRAEAAERKLYEYAAAFDRFKAEHEQVRARLERDVAAKVETRFGALAADLLEAVDDLDLALEHAQASPGAGPIVRGLAIARDRFVGMLERNGVARLALEGTAFDPNVAEAVAVEPVEDAGLDGRVVRVVRPGYRLGDRVIRPARVTVGRASN